MNKKFVSAVIAVVLGMSVFVMISSTVSLIFDAILSHDVTYHASVFQSMKDMLSYVRNSTIGIVVFSAAALASYCFTYYTKAKKVFGCISAGLSLALATFCIAFVFDLRRLALDSVSPQLYEAATAYFSEPIILAIAALLLCAYFTVITVKAFAAKTKTASEVVPEAQEEERNEAN